MFNDPNILQIKSRLVRSLAASFIANKRLDEARANYQAIGGKSPLVAHTFALCERLSELAPQLHFTYAMRYTPPLADMVAQTLADYDHIVLFSMYPHFSFTTTKSSIEDFERALNAHKIARRISKVERFFDAPAYNDAVIERIKDALNGEPASDFTLVFSAHSLPQKYIDAGDPYQKEILANAEILRKQLEAQGLAFQNTTVAYQSKLGPVKWLEPNLSDLIPQFRARKLLIYPIAFTIDNSETDFELRLQYDKLAKECELADYRVCQCLNDGEDFARAILAILGCE